MSTLHGVCKFQLNESLWALQEFRHTPKEDAGLLEGLPVEREALPTHIKELTKEKAPRSASEMAAIVAYFLENLAPPKDRKDRITTKDINTYFKVAGFPLPKKFIHVAKREGLWISRCRRKRRV